MEVSRCPYNQVTNSALCFHLQYLHFFHRVICTIVFKSIDAVFNSILLQSQSIEGLSLLVLLLQLCCLVLNFPVDFHYISFPLFKIFFICFKCLLFLIEETCDDCFKNNARQFYHFFHFVIDFCLFVSFEIFLFPGQLCEFQMMVGNFGIIL